jgi:hypothetical protein
MIWAAIQPESSPPDTSLEPGQIRDAHPGSVAQ